MRISNEYLELNRKLHAKDDNYGTTGKLNVTNVLELCQNMGTQDVLDYGCGKNTLAENLPFKIKQYDPAVPKFSQEPEPADLVVCTDVLEHIEPDCVDDVIDHLQSLTKGLLFVTVANFPAKKILEDGRNAHLIIEDYLWWLKKFDKKFILLSYNTSEIADKNKQAGFHKNIYEYIMLLKPVINS